MRLSSPAQYANKEDCKKLETPHVEQRTSSTQGREWSPKEIVFESALEADGGFTVEAIGGNILPPAGSRENARANARKVLQALDFDPVSPTSIWLSLVGEQVLAALAGNCRLSWAVKRWSSMHLITHTHTHSLSLSLSLSL
jgi:hypothetical protein